MNNQGLCRFVGIERVVERSCPVEQIRWGGEFDGNFRVTDEGKGISLEISNFKIIEKNIYV